MTIGDDWPYPGLRPLLYLRVRGNGLERGSLQRDRPIEPAGKVGNATGASMFFTFWGVIFGPAVFTTAFGMTGAYSSTFAVLAILAALALVTIWIANRHIRRESAKGSGAKMSE